MLILNIQRRYSRKERRSASALESENNILIQHSKAAKIDLNIYSIALTYTSHRQETRRLSNEIKLGESISPRRVERRAANGRR